jgi:hypothetical protein
LSRTFILRKCSSGKDRYSEHDEDGKQERHGAPQWRWLPGKRLFFVYMHALYLYPASGCDGHIGSQRDLDLISGDFVNCSESVNTYKFLFLQRSE